jgi:hypothetical protein
MTTAGWVFLVGFRVFDLGAMVAWLVWFRKQDGGADDGWDGGPGDDEPPGPAGPPRPDAGPWPMRRRDHASPEPARRPTRRSPEPQRAPARTAGPRN